MAQTTVSVPEIGDFDSVPVIEVLVALGDHVDVEDPLVTLESDKATMDVPSPFAGVVRDIMVSVGDEVASGTQIVVLERDGEQASNEPPDEPDSSRAPAAASADKAAGQDITLTVPDIGDFDAVPVIEVHVRPGSVVNVEDPLVTLESDKATMDVPATHAGTIRTVAVNVGDEIAQGAIIATLAPAQDDGSTAQATSAALPAEPALQESDPEPSTAPEDTSAKPQPSRGPAKPGRGSPTAVISAQPVESNAISHATPAIRRFARELGVDLGKVTGTGRKGRILRDDVLRFVKTSLDTPERATGAGIEPIPAVDFSKFGETQTRPLSRIKALSGPHLHRAWLNIPHVTHHDEADVTELEAFRASLKEDAKAQGVRLTPLSFIMKAMVVALREFPTFNASLSPDGESMILKSYFNIGIAVDTPNGLVVPVLRDVDKKGIFEISSELAEVSQRARDAKLSPKDLQGGCISISSLGGIGGIGFTPIINAPEVAILGVSRSRTSPVWTGESFAPRVMLPLDLSYDHRVIDGAEAARFMVHLAAVLSDIRRLVL